MGLVSGLCVTTALWVELWLLQSGAGTGQSLGPQVRVGWLVTGRGSLDSGASGSEARGVQVRTEALQSERAVLEPAGRGLGTWTAGFRGNRGVVVGPQT